MEFPRNNIEFRQHSSLVISHFKLAQHQLLSEVIADDRHAFSLTSKELLLQCFSIWAKWINKVEAEFILLHEQDVQEEQVEKIVHQLLEDYQKFVNFTKDDEYFDSTFISIWSIVFSSEVEVFTKRIAQKISGRSISSSFSAIVEMAKILMNHHLFVLQEIDSLLDEKVEDFLTLDRFDINLISETEDVLSVSRLKVYQSFGLDKEIFIKSYVDEQEIKASIYTARLFDSALSTLRQFVTITRVQ